jgi:hypothetical protein
MILLLCPPFGPSLFEHTGVTFPNFSASLFLQYVSLVVIMWVGLATFALTTHTRKRMAQARVCHARVGQRQVPQLASNDHQRITMLQVIVKYVSSSFWLACRKHDASVG